MGNPLFAGRTLDERLLAERQALVAKIDGIAPDLLLDRTVDETVADVLGRVSVQPIDIAWDRAHSAGVTETRVDMQHNFLYGGFGEGRPIMVPADQVEIRVPFVGDPEVLRQKPRTMRFNSMEGSLEKNELVTGWSRTDLTPEQITALFNQFREWVDFHVDVANQQIQEHNGQVEQDIRRLTSERRERLLRQRKITADLPFAIRPRGAEATYPIPVQRTRIHLTQARPAKPFEPEWALDQAVYEDVLGRIVALGNSMERSPSVAAKWTKEEELRDQLLFVLNAVYEGQAAGEVFNGSGKTDILLRIGDKNAFIAECKIWGGAVKFAEAIDQLLGYLVWRDSKAALIVFIRNGSPSQIAAKADMVVQEHPSLVRRLQPADPTRRVDYLLRNARDPDRTVHTALIPIGIPARAKPATTM